MVTEQNAMQTENIKRQRTVTQKSIETNMAQINLAKTVYEQTLLQQKQGIASFTDVLLQTQLCGRPSKITCLL